MSMTVLGNRHVARKVLSVKSVYGLHFKFDVANFFFFCRSSCFTSLKPTRVPQKVPSHLQSLIKRLCIRGNQAHECQRPQWWSLHHMGWKASCMFSFPVIASMRFWSGVNLTFKVSLSLATSQQKRKRAHPFHVAATSSHQEYAVYYWNCCITVY